MYLEIRRAHVVALAAACVMVALAGLGYLTSPRTDDGRPVLLSPEVQAVESYRHTSREWVRAWGTLLVRMANQDETGLLAQSQAAQMDFNESLRLAQAVEATTAPAVLLGVHERATATASAVMQAAVARNRWLSAPTTENQTVFADSLRRAQLALDGLLSNPWMTK